MGYRADTEGALVVSAQGVVLPEAPNRTVAVLLIGLLDSGEGWLSKAEVARRLYPDSEPQAAQNALRQSRHRLKNWLGSDVVEERQGAIRLQPGAFEVTWAEGQRLATGIEHPWVDEIRCSTAPAKPVPTSSPVVHLVRTVESISLVDRESALKILVAAQRWLVALPSDKASRLLSMVKPAAGSVLASDFLALRGKVRALLYDAPLPAAQDYETAFKIARRAGSRVRMATAASEVAFLYVEAGLLQRAEGWANGLRAFATVASTRVLAENARAALAWNANELAEAVQIMLGVRSDLDKTDQYEALHFWCNLSLLAAEAGDVELANQAIEEARKLISPEMDVGFCRTLAQAEGTRLMAEGDYASAVNLLANRGPAVEAGEQYRQETLAEALALAGEKRQAIEIWRAAESKRVSQGQQLPPRLVARKARILKVISP